MPIIRFDKARFSYDGNRDALAGVSLSVEPGSFTCVLGGNGSGKSTLAKHVNVLLRPDSGSVTVAGLDTSDPDNAFPVRSRVGMVFQNPDDQIVASIIENDVAFGPENLGVPSEQLRKRVESALEQVGLQGFEKKQTETLSGGQKQRVALAGVLAMEPEILVLDEASAMLDPRGRTGLMRVCRELNESGMAVVLITHFMEEAAIADRIVVMDGGTIAMDGTPDEVFAEYEKLAKLALDVPFATQMSARLRDLGITAEMHTDIDELERALARIAEQAGHVAANADAGPSRKSKSCSEPFVYSKSNGTGNRKPDGAEAPCAIEFEGVSFTYEPVSQKRHRKSSVARSGKQADWGRTPGEYWALRDLSFDVRPGEFFGIAGHTGSGKSTLIQLANGLLKPTEGVVRIEGNPITDKRAAIEARRGVGVVFQYPEHQLFASTVFDDVAFGPRNLGRAAEDVERDVDEALRLVHLDLESLRGRNPFSLSGGQQRRVAFAGVLAMHPHTLVLDEPVAGLDPRAKRRFLELLEELHAKQGLTVVVVSHNMDDLAQLCDRMLVLNEGRLFALGAPADVFADEPALKNVGLGVPQPAHLANRLIAQGIPLNVSAVPSADELACEIARIVQARHEDR